MYPIADYLSDTRTSFRDTRANLIGRKPMDYGLTIWARCTPASKISSVFLDKWTLQVCSETNTYAATSLGSKVPESTGESFAQPRGQKTVNLDIYFFLFFDGVIANGFGGTQDTDRYIFVLSWLVSSLKA